MAAIVTTLACVPLIGVLAIVGMAAPATSFHGLITFAGAVNAFQGVLLWWALVFVPALAYAAIALDWHS